MTRQEGKWFNSRSTHRETPKVSSVKLLTIEALEKEGFFNNLDQVVSCHCNLCDEDSVFTCECCRREVPYCYGASDSFEDLCDDCAVRQQAHQEYLASI